MESPLRLLPLECTQAHSHHEQNKIQTVTVNLIQCDSHSQPNSVRLSVSMSVPYYFFIPWYNQIAIKVQAALGNTQVAGKVQAGLEDSHLRSKTQDT
jgi:hypothetical protein